MKRLSAMERIKKLKKKLGMKEYKKRKKDR